MMRDCEEVGRTEYKAEVFDRTGHPEKYKADVFRKNFDLEEPSDIVGRHVRYM